MSRKQAQTQKNKRHFRWLKLLIICAAVFAVTKMGQQYQRYLQIQSEAERYRQELVQAQSEYQGLQEQVKLLYRDSYLEQIARSSLGMIKEGEVVVSPAEISEVPTFDTKIKSQDVLH